MSRDYIKNLKRLCKVCDEIKPIESFRVVGGYRKHKCKDCLNVYRRSQYECGETELSIRARKLIRDYGITIEEYEEMCILQNHVCAICKQTCVTENRLSIDHCHKTGKIRGLQSNSCNNGIGRFRDNPDLLIAAATYLKKSM